MLIMANARWDSAVNVRFIEAYQNNVCLWDPKNPLYKNRQARDAAYRNIIHAMKMDLRVKDVISKIRSLRNTYNSEMLKVKKSATTGTRQLYKSKIPWLDSLDFLKNIEGFTKMNTNTLNEQASMASPSISLNFETNDISNAEDSNSSNRSSKKTKTWPLTKAVKVLEKGPSQQRKDDECDEFDSFGNLVAKQLRSLPLEVALQSEELILATLRKQRMKALNETYLLGAANFKEEVD